MMKKTAMLISSLHMELFKAGGTGVYKSNHICIRHICCKWYGIMGEMKQYEKGVACIAELYPVCLLLGYSFKAITRLSVEIGPTTSVELANTQTAAASVTNWPTWMEKVKRSKEEYWIDLLGWGLWMLSLLLRRKLFQETENTWVLKVDFII